MDFRSKVEATSDAVKLAKRMGKGWKPFVWKNWDTWHASADKAPFTIYVESSGYHIMMSDNKDGTHYGTCCWNSSMHGTDPVKMIKTLTKRAMVYCQRMLDFSVHISHLVQDLPKK